ncbi:DUF2029 domain-containing protein [Nibrella saemangeumensis]|uniref:DUF2029 domain-containing protein n=1 Tax=Nibrella saemangeumensis TaxID=1084526 RepID=A0ABP8NMT1_9BACT
MTLTPFRIGWLALSAGLYIFIAYGVPREQFGTLLSLYGLLFWGYLLRVRPLWYHRLAQPGDSGTIPGFSEAPDRFLFAASIAFRLTLLFALPRLSDDFYRFIWDGRLLVHGFNPYLYLPSGIINSPLADRAGVDGNLFIYLNSPDYYTVYPPLNQALFGLAAMLSPDNVLGNVVTLRVSILLAELGVLWLLVRLLKHFNRNPNLALLYGLNPLVILELTGNVHFEAIVIFFVLMAVWLLVKNRWVLSAGALALAVCTKLLPLLFLPLAIQYLGWRRGIAYAALTLVLTGILFLPFASVALVQNVFSSINLYFQKFEFNASVYYLIREVGFWIKGYNIIVQAGFWLSLVTTLGVLWIAFNKKLTNSVSTKLILTLTLYFALATTVHPWYATTLIAVSVFTNFRFPLVWSGLIWLSYATYQSGLPYRENLLLTAVEYLAVVGYGLYEYWINKNPHQMPEHVMRA